MSTTVSELEVRIGANTSGLDGGLTNAEQNIQGFVGRAGGKLAGFALSSALNMGAAAVGIGGASLQIAVAWESAFAGVEKTVSGTTDELSALETGLRDLATSADSPVSALENAHIQLASIAETAGQLGVPTQDILGFTETMGMLAMTTDMTAEEAAVFAARFANVTGMDFSNVDLLGDTIVTLGNNMAAQEGEIAEFATRLATLSQFNFSEADILGISGGMASLGLSPELGATNFNKFISEMGTAVAQGGEQLELFADTAGMSMEDFRTSFETDPATAVQAFMTAMSGMSASEQIATLDALGLSGTEMHRVIMTMAAGEETLADGIEMANDAWQGNNALVEEAGKRADTTEGKMARFSNAMTDLGITLGNAFLPVLTDVAEGATTFVDGLNEIAQGNHEEGLQAIADGLGQMAQPFADLLGLDIDVGAGLNAFIESMRMGETLLKIIFDRIARGIDRFALDAQIRFMQFALGFRDMVLNATGGSIDIAPDLNMDIADLQLDLMNMDTADQIADALKSSMSDGTIDLSGNAWQVDMGEGFMLDVPWSDVLADSLMLQNMASGFGEEGRMAVQGALENAIGTGNEEAFNMLLPLALELEMESDIGALLLADLQESAAEGEASPEWVQDMAVDIDPLVDIGEFHSDLMAALEGQAVSVSVPVSVSPSVTTSGGLGFSGIPEFHGGGVFNSGRGEGLALLQDGEQVLTPEETRAYNSGAGAGPSINISVSAVGQDGYAIAQMVRREMEDMGYS